MLELLSGQWLCQCAYKLSNKHLVYIDNFGGPCSTIVDQDLDLDLGLFLAILQVVAFRETGSTIFHCSIYCRNAASASTSTTSILQAAAAVHVGADKQHGDCRQSPG